MDDKPPPGTVHSVTSFGQQGGITAHTVHVPQLPPRAFGEAQKADVLRIVPRDEPVAVMAPMGDQEATHLASLIHAFLRSAGQRLQSDCIMVAPFAQPPKGIILQATRAGHDLIVGSQ